MAKKSGTVTRAKNRAAKARNTRTYRWYTSHDTYVGRDDYYSTDDDQSLFSETHSHNIETALEPLGILDEVPNFDNLIPLVDEYSKWWERVDKSWKVYENAQKARSHLVALHWILGRIIQDPTLTDRDRILEYVARNSPNNIIEVVYNPKVSESLLLEILYRDPKKDPTQKTKGGEVGCFVLHNKHITWKVVDVVARKTKKIGIQRDCVGHPNVLRETLVFLSKDGKSSTVKKDALKVMMERGWLDVK